MKKVRFADTTTLESKNCAVHVSPLLADECVGQPRYRAGHEPITSEYRNYQKLLDQMNCKTCPKSRHDVDRFTKKFQPGHWTREDGSPVPRPPEARSSTLSEDASNIAGSSKEKQCKFADIFTRKRRRLLQLAAETLSVEVDDLYSRGSDLISDFMRRLGIDKSKHYCNISHPPHQSSSLFEEWPNSQRMRDAQFSTGFEEVNDFFEGPNLSDSVIGSPWNDEDCSSLSVGCNVSSHCYKRNQMLLDCSSCIPKKFRTENDVFNVDSANTFDRNYLASETMPFQLKRSSLMPLCWHSTQSCDLQESILQNQHKFYHSRKLKNSCEGFTLQAESSFSDMEDDTHTHSCHIIEPSKPMLEDGGGKMCPLAYTRAFPVFPNCSSTCFPLPRGLLDYSPAFNTKVDSTNGEDGDSLDIVQVPLALPSIYSSPDNREVSLVDDPFPCQISLQDRVLQGTHQKVMDHVLEPWRLPTDLGKENLCTSLYREHQSAHFPGCKFSETPYGIGHWLYSRWECRSNHLNLPAELSFGTSAIKDARAVGSVIDAFEEGIFRFPYDKFTWHEAQEY